MEKRERILMDFDLLTANAAKDSAEVQRLAAELGKQREILATPETPEQWDAETLPTEAALSDMHQLALIRDAATRAVEAIARELLARRVTHQAIADMAEVHRVTVTRWAKALREERAAKMAERGDAAPLFED